MNHHNKFISSSRRGILTVWYTLSLASSHFLPLSCPKLQENINELEYRQTVSLVEYRKPIPASQVDAWKNSAEYKANAQLYEVNCAYLCSCLALSTCLGHILPLFLCVTSICLIKHLDHHLLFPCQVLNAALPPVHYVDDTTGVPMVKFVSAAPSSRDAVIALQMRLHQLLEARQARLKGVCPVREELYSQCFDELIRQVIIESPERGLLLLRVRDETRMTVQAYQTLFQSSVAFGSKKSVESEQGNTEFQQRIDELEEAKRALMAQLADQNGLRDALEKRSAELKALDDKRRNEEIEFLQHQSSQLEAFIQGMVPQQQ